MDGFTPEKIIFIFQAISSKNAVLKNRKVEDLKLYFDIKSICFFCPLFILFDSISLKDETQTVCFRITLAPPPELLI